MNKSKLNDIAFRVVMFFLYLLSITLCVVATVEGNLPEAFLSAFMLYALWYWR